MISSYVLDFTKGAVQGVMIIFSFFHPAGKAGGSQIRRCQGIAVKRYGFTLGVLALTPSGFCNVRVTARQKGRDALNIRWSKGPHPQLNDDALDALFKEHLEKPGAVAKTGGDVKKALGEAAVTIEQSYKLPYISHAQAEPINCTAHVEKERCRVWVPTQRQTASQLTASKLTGLPIEKVEVMTLPAGGGFGHQGYAVFSPQPACELCDDKSARDCG
jgi:xanthine dehydrogenase molybdopterin-binding subunit B